MYAGISFSGDHNHQQLLIDKLLFVGVEVNICKQSSEHLFIQDIYMCCERIVTQHMLRRSESLLCQRIHSRACLHQRIHSERKLATFLIIAQVRVIVAYGPSADHQPRVRVYHMHCPVAISVRCKTPASAVDGFPNEARNNSAKVYWVETFMRVYSTLTWSLAHTP